MPLIHGREYKIECQGAEPGSCEFIYSPNKGKGGRKPSWGLWPHNHFCLLTCLSPMVATEEWSCCSLSSGVENVGQGGVNGRHEWPKPQTLDLACACPGEKSWTGSQIKPQGPDISGKRHLCRLLRHTKLAWLFCMQSWLVEFILEKLLQILKNLGKWCPMLSEDINTPKLHPCGQTLRQWVHLPLLGEAEVWTRAKRVVLRITQGGPNISESSLWALMQPTPGNFQVHVRPVTLLGSPYKSNILGILSFPIHIIFQHL